MRHTVLVCFLCLCSFIIQAKETQKVGITEHLGDHLPTDIELTNTNGDLIQLESLLGNKPLVLNLVYYRCPGVCTPLMDGLTEVVNQSDMVLGEDYQVITISFNHNETYDLALKKRNNYSMVVQQANMKDGWLFFTADSANVAKLTQATGFSFKRTGNDFIHSAGLILISPEGKITRYLNGTYFLPFEFKLAIIEASKGIPGPTINRILQFCYSYDPDGQSYVLNITKLAGTIILIIAGLALLILTLKPKQKNRNLIQ